MPKKSAQQNIKKKKGAYKMSPYWESIIGEVEKCAQQKTRDQHIKINDYALSVPAELRTRLEKLLEYEFDEHDATVFYPQVKKGEEDYYQSDEDDLDDNDEVAIIRREKERVRKDADFNESTCSDIERLEKEFERFELQVDVPITTKVVRPKIQHWMADYVCKPQEKRIKWDSRVYKSDASQKWQTLDERAEELMDASAERFCEWLNPLGKHREQHLSKQRLKSLFSIEIDRIFLASITTEPKEVNAIAQTIAKKWNMPEMAIEWKYEHVIKDRWRKKPKVTRTFAFGRCIPTCERPWIPMSRDRPITTVYPKEILTGAKLFKGIGHLRSVRALVDFYRAHPEVERPGYIVKEGWMEQKKVVKVQNVEKPLYEKLKLKA